LGIIYKEVSHNLPMTKTKGITLIILGALSFLVMLFGISNTCIVDAFPSRFMLAYGCAYIWAIPSIIIGIVLIYFGIRSLKSN